MPKSQDEPLGNEPFSFSVSKDDVVRISHERRVVKTLRGREAVKFLDKIARADPAQQQQLMAKATGQFKFGNERRNQ